MKFRTKTHEIRLLIFLNLKACLNVCKLEAKFHTKIMPIDEEINLRLFTILRYREGRVEEITATSVLNISLVFCRISMKHGPFYSPQRVLFKFF